MTEYYLNIGSNLGCRELNISRALRELEKTFGWFETSKAATSEPWGFESPHAFKNIGVKVISDLSPREVLDIVKTAERAISKGSHRRPDGSYADRVIDIDIVAAGDLVVEEPDLRIPHPHLPERDFFLKPMIELAPGWRHPVNGMTCGEMLRMISER